MEIPVKPVVPPAPSAMNPADYPAKHDAWAASIAPIVGYVDQAVNQVSIGLAEVAATANLGDLPALTGHAGKFTRVNSGATAIEFVAPASMLETTALTNLTALHNSTAIVGSLRDWNFANGATDVLNRAIWTSGAVVSGVTFTVDATGVDSATGESWVRYALSGTMGATSIEFGYAVAQSVIAATIGQSYTASAKISTSGLPANLSARVRVNDGGAGQNGTAINTSTLTLSTATRVAAGASLNCGVRITASSTGTVVTGATVTIQGLQFEAGTSRTNGALRELRMDEVTRAARAESRAYAETNTIVAATGTTPSHIMLSDGTIPQITEGAQVLPISYTPRSATSRLRITAHIPNAFTNATGEAFVILALFRTGQSSALAVTSPTTFGDNVPTNATLVHEFAHGQPANVALEFSLRIGVSDSGYTASVNGTPAGTRLFGDTSRVSITVEEIGL